MDDKSLKNIQVSSDNLYADVCLIVDTAQRQAYNAVNVALVQRDWLIYKRITEEKLKGDCRAEYGAEIIKLEYLEEHNVPFSILRLRSSTISIWLTQTC